MMKGIEHGIAGSGVEFHFKDIFPRQCIGIFTRFDYLATGIFITQKKMGEAGAFSENVNGRFPAAGTKVGEGLPGQGQAGKVVDKAVIYVEPGYDKSDEFRLEFS
jgi:hypothetical protein